MTKPKELSGIVFKFENVAYLSDNLEDNLNIKEFYTQPFKPEMIEEYFNNTLQLGEGRALVYEYKIRKLTLSDFIDACINSNIELEWK